MTDITQLEDLIRQGHYAQARTRAEELLKLTDALRVKQLYAFALSKSGVPEAARDFLESVAKDNPNDPETNGILGGIFKELFKKNESSTFAVLARDTYDKNFKATNNYYTGINSATMSTLAGQGRRGKEIAQEVLNVLTDPDEDFWQAATQAEAFLLLKERTKSETAYLKARKLAGSDWGKINSVYNQLWLLKHYLPVPPEAVRAFSPPVVVTFTGHMVDHPESAIVRFPPALEAQVKQAIANAINSVNGKIGYCSLACGGDILFAEAMEEAGGELNLFLPFRREDFIDASVGFAGGDWLDRFNRLIEKYPVTYLTREPYDNHPDLFSLLASIIFGLSILRSHSNHQEPTLITLLSERDQRRKQGGVRDTLSIWPNQRNHISINPDVFLAPLANIPTTIESVSPGIRTDRPVLYFVCCDLSLESKHNESLIELMKEGSLPPVVFQIRERQLIAGFRTIMAATEFCDVISSTLVHQFTKKSAIRTGLHVGPFLAKETKHSMDLAGSLIDKLLLIQSLATPGTIYASALVAAILALNKTKYAFDYVDTFPGDESDKGFDVYRVRLK